MQIASTSSVLGRSDHFVAMKASPAGNSTAGRTWLPRIWTDKGCTMAMCSVSGRLMRPGVASALVLAFALGTSLCFGMYQSAATGSADDDQFKSGLDAYEQNRFTAAENLLKGVRGTHAQEAKQYVEKIVHYKNALQVAHSELQRSPDELDPDSLTVAIESLQEA